MSGFSLLEVRKLYLDEMFDFYTCAFYVLENRGEAKKGTYERMSGIGKGEDTVNQLRTQLFKAVKSKK